MTFFNNTWHLPGFQIFKSRQLSPKKATSLRSVQQECRLSTGFTAFPFGIENSLHNHKDQSLSRTGKKKLKERKPHRPCSSDPGESMPHPNNSCQYKLCGLHQVEIKRVFSSCRLLTMLRYWWKSCLIKFRVTLVLVIWLDTTWEKLITLKVLYQRTLETLKLENLPAQGNQLKNKLWKQLLWRGADLPWTSQKVYVMLKVMSF